MSDINLSKAVRSNLLSLQNTANLMSKTQGRLATGLKVNSALDNPTNFFTASSLNSRAGDINQLLDSMANGIQTLEAADNGLKAITKTLESMQSTLRQARQDKSFQTQSFTLDASSIDTATVNNLSFAGGAVVGEVNVALNTADQTPVQSTAVGTSFTTPIAGSEPDDLIGNATALLENQTYNFSVNGVEFSITADSGDMTADDVATAVETAVNDSTDPALSGISVVATAAELTFANTNIGGTTTIGGTNASDIGFGAGNNTETGTAAESFTITVAGQEITLDNANASDAAAAAATISTALTGTGFSAVEDGGNIRINGPTDGSADVTISGDADALTAIFGSDTAPNITPGDEGKGEVNSVDDLVRSINNNVDLRGKIRASNDNGSLRIENLSTQGLDIGGVSTDGEIDGTSSLREDVIGGNQVRADLANQFRELRDQLDKLADDASFNGINLLRGDNLQITFNETGTSELNIRSKDEQGINSGVLNIESNLQAEALDSDANIDDLLADVKTAINDVRSQSSAFGSSLSIVQNRQDFSKNMINTLQTGASNLTLADTNEEAANLLALQTRQQLSSTALSMASQADQAVLRLF